VVTLGSKYVPYFCEENIWHLCQDPVFEGLERRVVFISNAERQCPVWCQRSAAAPGEPVVWDYHVILFVQVDEQWRVYDLDTVLGLDVPMVEYLQQSFAPRGLLPLPWAQRFRVIEADTYVQHFSSDRSHMRQGPQWKAQPPAWPCILADDAQHNLFDFVDTHAPFYGSCFDLPGLCSWFGV